MAATYEELMAKADRADQAGDTDAARDLVAMARWTRDNGAVADPHQQLLDAALRADQAGDTSAARKLMDAYYGAKEAPGGRTAASFGNAAVDTYADFGRGVTQGAKDMSRAGQKLIARGVGRFIDEDTGAGMLKQVENKDAADAEQMAPYKERSPWAVGGGELVGETLFTAPVGGAGAVGGKAALSGASRLLTGNAAKQGTFKLGAAGLTGEGAAVGAYMSGGQDMAGSAAVGAAVGLGAGALINGVTKSGGVLLRDRLNSERAGRAVDDALSAATKRINDASEFGGYNLNGATALATRRSADEYSRLKNDPDVGQRLLDAEAQVEQDVTQRATDIAGRYGPTDDLTRGQEAGRTVQRSMTAIRRLDERNYRNLYKEFDRLAAETETFIDTSELGVKLSALRGDNTNVAKEGFMRKIDKQLSQYGIDLSGEPRVAASATDRALPGATVAGEPGSKRLTLENMENLVVDLNEFWTDSLSPAKKSYLEQVKGEVSSYIDTALQDVGDAAGVGSEVYEIGRKARQARRAYSQDWSRKDIIDKMTTRTAGGEFALDYSKVLSRLESKDVATVKARLLGKPGGQRAWKSMQQAPLLEALSAAVKDSSEGVTDGGGIVFKHKAFEATLNRLLPNRADRVTLWGEDMVKALEQTVDSWKDRYRKPSTAGSLNPSGTALTLMKQLRFLPTGKSRSFGTALSASLPVIGATLARGAKEEAADTILRGRGVPEPLQNEMITDALMNFEKDFVGAGGQKYGDVLRYFMRPGAVIVATDEG